MAFVEIACTRLIVVVNYRRRAVTVIDLMIAIELTVLKL
jgi:hypothetical protein